MKFFMKKENVDKYIEMIEDYDGTWLLNKLGEFLKLGASLLELGMGAGKDLDILSRNYNVIGSDNSEIFLDRYRKLNTGIKVINLDAIEMNIYEKFDCIYSNKVLHHLTREDFIKSIKNQKKNLNEDGIIFMTLWRGKYKEEMMFNDEVRFTYYLESDIEEIVKDDYEVVHMEAYKEFEEEENDSLLVVLKRN